MPPFFAASLLHPQPIKHRGEHALTTSSVKHLETSWILFCVAPMPLRLPKTKQKKTEESFENNVMKRKSISYAFLKLMTSIKEKELMDHNLRRTLCHAVAETFEQRLLSRVTATASLKHLPGPLGQKVAWWPWIINDLLSHSPCWQYVSKRHAFAKQGLSCFTWEKGLSFQHEFEFSGETGVIKKIWDVELK